VGVRLDVGQLVRSGGFGLDAGDGVHIGRHHTRSDGEVQQNSPSYCRLCLLHLSLISPHTFAL
jgi:hypothetical protein